LNRTSFGGANLVVLEWFARLSRLRNFCNYVATSIVSTTQGKQPQFEKSGRLVSEIWIRF